MKELIVGGRENAVRRHHGMLVDGVPVVCAMVDSGTLLGRDPAGGQVSPLGISVVFHGAHASRLHRLVPTVIAVADVRGMKNGKVQVQYAFLSPVMLKVAAHANFFARHGVAVHDLRFFVQACASIGMIDPVDSITCTHLAATLLDLGLHHRDYLGHAHPGSDTEEMAIGRDPTRCQASTLQALLDRYGLDLDVPFLADEGGLPREHPVVASDTDVTKAAVAASILACATALVAPPLLRDLAADDLMDTYRRVQVPAAIGLAHLEREGVRLDIDLARHAIDACSVVEDATASMLARAGLTSPLVDAVTVPELRAAGALDGPVLTTRGWERLSLRDLGMMASRHPVLDALHRHRLAHYAGRGVLRQCVEGADERGRIHPIIRPLGTDTGRPSFACPNLAGLARVFRPTVVPDSPDFGIVEFDFKAQEIGITAALYRDEGLIRDWNDSDIYMTLVRRLVAPALGLDVRFLDDDRVRVMHPRLRDQAKVLTLGITYGMSPAGVALRLGITAAAAERLMAGFFAAYPGVEAGMRRQHLLLSRAGAVATISGLKRHRPATGTLEHWERRWAVNAPVQGSGADVLKVTLPGVMAYVAGIGGRVLLPVYDSLVVQLPLPLRDEPIETIRQMMASGFKGLFPMLEPRVSVNSSAPQCWNHDGAWDSVRNFAGTTLGRRRRQ